MNDKQNHMKGRQRGRNGGGGGGGGGGGKPRIPGRNPNFDGGGNNRPRGNAQQLMEKYLALARDAQTAGDRVLAENYFQHADHYYRVLNARFEQQNNNGQRRFDGQGQGGQHFDNRQGYGNDRYDGDQQPQNGQGGYQQPPQHQHQNHQPQPQHHNAAPEPEHHSGNDVEIALPPGILGDAPVETSAEPQEAEGQQEGGEQSRERGGRERGRRRRGGGRGERPAATAASE